MRFRQESHRGYIPVPGGSSPAHASRRLLDGCAKQSIGAIPFRENDGPAGATTTSAAFRARVGGRFAVELLQAVASRARSSRRKRCKCFGEASARGREQKRQRRLI
jgi:hypothetical protein